MALLKDFKIGAIVVIADSSQTLKGIVKEIETRNEVVVVEWIGSPLGTLRYRPEKLYIVGSFSKGTKLKTRLIY